MSIPCLGMDSEVTSSFRYSHLRNIVNSLDPIIDLLNNDYPRIKEECITLKEENADLKNRIEQMEKRMNALMEFVLTMK
jgi:hypothetical protein